MYLVEALSKLEKTFVTECWDDFETAGEDGHANSLNRSQILIFQPLGISIHQISRKLIYLVGALSKLEKTSVTEF